MSNLRYAQGNLIDMAMEGRFNVIVHGCNCWNTMGSGIAREIRERIPAAWEADQRTRAGDYDKLGNYTVGLGKRFNTINAYTQYNFNRGAEREDLFEYTSFALILQKLAFQYRGCHFGFPYIGMGLAGGDRDVIIQMLSDFADKVSESFGSVTLVEFVPNAN